MTRLTCLLLALGLGLLGVVLSPRTAYACSCSGTSNQSSAQRADAIFTGRVLAKKVVRRPRPGRTDIRFAVSRVYKGTVYQQQVVASPRGDEGCGIDPDVDSSWVIFAEEQLEGSGNHAVFRLVAELCSGNLPGAMAPVYLGPGRAPLTGASDREEKSVVADARFTRVLEVGAGVVATLAVLVAAGLAYLWRPGRPGG